MHNNWALYETYFPNIFEEEDRTIKYVVPSFSPIHVLITSVEKESATLSKYLGCTSETVIGQWFTKSVHKYPYNSMYDPYISRGTFVIYTASKIIKNALESHQLKLENKMYVTSKFDFDICVLKLSVENLNPTRYFYVGDLRYYLLFTEYREAYRYDVFNKFLEQALCSNNSRPSKEVGQISNPKFSHASALLQTFRAIFKNYTLTAFAVDYEHLKTLKCSGEKLLAEKIAKAERLTFQMHLVYAMVESRIDDEDLFISNK